MSELSIEKQNLYDSVMAKIFQNVATEDAYNDGIYINGYKDTPLCKTYMEMVNSYADLSRKNVVMLMPFFTYIKFILKHWKQHKKYTWGGNIQSERYATIQQIVECVCESFDIPVKILDEIYKEYYSNK